MLKLYIKMPLILSIKLLIALNNSKEYGRLGMYPKIVWKYVV